MRRRGSNLGWIILITAPFALLAKSLTLFGKAIMTLFKPSPRVHKRPHNYQMEDDVKRSRIALNKARGEKVRAEIRLLNAKAQTVLNNSETSTDTLNKAKQEKIQAEIKLIHAKVDALLNSSGVVSSTLTAMGVNAKDYMGCAECNWIDSTGKDVKCPKCGKPLRPINW